MSSTVGADRLCELTIGLVTIGVAVMAIRTEERSTASQTASHGVIIVR